MEKINSDLKISELKESSLCKAYEELHSQASSILVFSLQWKDLENHFGSTRMSLKSGLEQLLEREKDIDSREKLLESKESQLNSKLKSQETLLVDNQKLLGQSMNELESKKQHVASIKLLIEETQEELEIKEKQHYEIQKSIAEKEREIYSVNSSLKDGEEKLGLLEKRVKQKFEEAESKGKELETIRKSLRGYKDDIELHNRKYNAIRRSLEERKREVDLKEEQLRMCRRSIDECDKEIKLKEEKINAIQNSLVNCSNELELKEKRLDLVRKDVELKEQNFASLKKSLDQCAQKFEMNEGQIEGFMKNLESKVKFFELKVKELDLFENNVNECLKELELREKILSSLQKSIDERYRELEKKEIEFEKRVNEFNVRQKEFDNSSKNSTESTGKENIDSLHSRVKVEQLEYTHINKAIVPLSANHEYTIPKEGKALQLLLNRHLKRHDLLCSEIFAVLKSSSDPAKLVLDAMQGFHPSHSSREDREFDVNIVRRSCILLLEQLKEASPRISPQVKEEAMKLVNDWKAKMMVENGNYLEALGFLQFLASYGLTKAFDADELDSVFDAIGQQGQPSELRQALCPADKPPDEEEWAENLLANFMTSSLNFHTSTLQNNILAFLQQSSDPAKLILDFIQGSFSQHWKKGDVDFEASVMNNYIVIFEELFRIGPEIQPLVKDDAMKLATKWKAKMRATAGNCLEILGFLQFLAAYGLIFSFDGDEIVKFLKIISQHEGALKYCRVLGFADKISEFVENLIKRKKLIDAVRLSCAFKLTVEFSPVNLLTEYVGDLKTSTEKNCKGKKPFEEKEKFTDHEIEALGDVILCIKNCELESKFPSSQIKKRIALLEKIKKDRRRSAQMNSNKGPKVEQREKQQPSPPWKKRRNNTFAQPRGKHKFPRTSASMNVGPNRSLEYISIVPEQVQREVNLAYAKDPSQFGLAESSINGPIFGPGVQLPT